MTRDLIMGIDASTTACKCIVWNLLGELVSAGRAEIPLLKPQREWHEQCAADWWDALIKSVRTAVSSLDVHRLLGVCICPQRETFVPVDRLGVPIRNAILWMDNRARSWLSDLESTLGGDRFHQKTGKPASGNLSLLKIRWLQEHEPETFERTFKFLDVAAFLNHHLTGEYATGMGIADPTGLFDMQTARWADEILAYLDIDQTRLPTVHPAGTQIGALTAEAAQATRLPEGLPVFAGLGDGQAGGLGLNITSSGDCYLSLGTSVVSGTFTNRYVTSRAFRTMFAGVVGSYSLETVILGGTYTIDWFLDQFTGGRSIAELELAAGKIPPGENGLVLVPYWNSALNPYWDSKARGIVIGWTGDHGPAHLYRAILEGIAYELRLHLEGVEAALGAGINRLVVMGGGAKSDLWCQIIADVTGSVIHRTDITETTALGAGIIAAAGAGIFPDLHTAAAQMSAVPKDSFHPVDSASKRYSQHYQEVYKDLFPTLQPIITRLSVSPP